MSREPLSAADAKRLYDQAALLAKVGAWECELARETLTWTDGVYDLFGLPRGSTLHRPSTVDLYHDDSRAEMQRLRAKAIASGGGFSMEAHIRTPAGEDRWMRLVANVACENGRPVRIYGAKQDITHEKAMWASLRELAYSDPLTGLANRRVFESRCEELLGYGYDDAALSALAVLDVDLFKQINDQFGHAAGDECLRQIAARLERVFEGAVLIARIGGDEFAVLLRLPLGLPHLTLLLDHALRVLACPVVWHGHPIEIGVSIGVTLLRPAHRHDNPKLFAEADSALYLAKTAGRNQARLFGAAIDAPVSLGAIGPRMAEPMVRML